jgi:hypothetical protein
MLIPRHPGHRLSDRLSGVGFGRGRKCLEALEKGDERYAGKAIDAESGNWKSHLK